MKLWIKRAAAAVLIVLGAVLFLRHLRQLLRWPHLYPDLSQFGAGNVIFLALTLLLVALAWIAAAYLLLNAGERTLRLLIPAAAFVLLLTLGGLCLTGAVGEIPCSYTGSVASYREEFSGESFRVRGKSLYPTATTGELSAYARYEKGEVLAESVTRSYDQDEFTAERNRLTLLGMPVTEIVQDPRERPTLCYTLRLGEAVWQVVVVPKTKTVTYSRFNCPDRLPSFAPQPLEEPTAES